jgi:hypothetical protein
MAGLDRRTFLRTLASGAVACAAGRVSAETVSPGKLVVVQFGGGTRNSETIADPNHRHIPRLWKEMVPHGTLYTDMRVEGPVVHSNSTASWLTGHWEYADLDWSQPPEHPTMFELYRQATGAADTAAWAFVYASLLARTGESKALGARFAANVVVPPTIPREVAEEFDGWIGEARSTGSREAESAALLRAAHSARARGDFSLAGLRSPEARKFVETQIEAWRKCEDSTSHDLFLAESALACMERFAPDVLTVCFGEIDCAHYGSWSRYLQAIERTDELTYRLWQASHRHPAYRGHTRFLILPDHGRELERPGGPGFIHHSDFYTNTGADEGCRRVWMLALGPGVAAGKQIARPFPITAVAATGLGYLGVRPSVGAQPAVDR